MRARILRLAAGSTLVCAATCLGAGCASDAAPPIELLATAQWNRDPPTLDAIGYQVWVDFGWPSRTESCFALPMDLTVTLNDRQATPPRLGECVWDTLVQFDAVPPDAPVHVRVASGKHVYGEATYNNLFPGYGAQFIPAGDGTFHVGDAIAVAFPSSAVPTASDVGAGHFYWLDAQPSGIPYYTFANAPDGFVPNSVVIAAPATTGQATLVVQTVLNGGYAGAASCSGFEHCTSLPNSDTIGPIAVNIIP
jgi:hypothetical protein